MVVRELQPAAGRHYLSVEVYGLQLRPPEAGAELDQGTAQGLFDVLGLHVAAYDPRHHRPVGEEVLFVDDHDPDVVTFFGELAERLRYSISGKPATHN